MKYEPVIGLEVHVELNTKSKMFCRCSADYFGKEPNTHTCPVCLGLPGALPFINKAAIEDCMKIGLALNCTVSERSLFERKNYFYPDLAKGYQISQLVKPLCVQGEIEVEDSQGNTSKIRINRAHQEEDTGKLTHTGGETLIDFNRSGVPLVEIVTEPDFTDSSQIRDYAKKLQQIFRYLGVSNADMERGDMRLEADVSVRPVGQKELPKYRVELKNINSFRFMVAAVEYEIKRQIEALEKGERLHQETRGWDEDKKQTYLQRSKEEANDYRYFPEPDLPVSLLGPGAARRPPPAGAPSAGRLCARGRLPGCVRAGRDPERRRRAWGRGAPGSGEVRGRGAGSDGHNAAAAAGIPGGPRAARDRRLLRRVALHPASRAGRHGRDRFGCRQRRADRVLSRLGDAVRGARRLLPGTPPDLREDVSRHRRSDPDHSKSAVGSARDHESPVRLL